MIFSLSRIFLSFFFFFVFFKQTMLSEKNIQYHSHIYIYTKDIIAFLQYFQRSAQVSRAISVLLPVSYLLITAKYSGCSNQRSNMYQRYINVCSRFHSTRMTCIDFKNENHLSILWSRLEQVAQISVNTRIIPIFLYYLNESKCQSAIFV